MASKGIAQDPQSGGEIAEAYYHVERVTVAVADESCAADVSVFTSKDASDARRNAVSEFTFGNRYVPGWDTVELANLSMKYATGLPELTPVLEAGQVLKEPPTEIVPVTVVEEVEILAMQK